MTKSLLTTIAAVVAAFCVCAAHAQQTEEITLPQVTVTAPSVVPLYLRATPGDWLNTKAYQRNPYYGNNRVEEGKFTPVLCSDSIARVAPVSSGSCLEGYHLIPAWVAGRDAKGDCKIDHDVTIYETGDLSVEADVFVFDPYKLTALGFPPRGCYVAGYSGYDQADFQDMNRITRGGIHWHDLRGMICAFNYDELRAACQEKSIRFSYESHDCIAVRRPGPRWGEGYVWMLTASICRTDAAGLRPDDVARALGRLQIRTHDPEGNIARPQK